MKQFDDFRAIARLRPAHHAQWERDVFVSSEMVEKPEILEDDANSPSQTGESVLVQLRGVVAKYS